MSVTRYVFFAVLLFVAGMMLETALGVLASACLLIAAVCVAVSRSLKK